LTLISRLSAVFFLLFVFGGVALAEDKLRPLPEFAPMAFSIVRSISPGCEPSCPEWIFAQGQIVANSPTGLKRILKVVGTRKLPILVQSPGGDIDAAMAMGRLIRERKLDVGVSGTRFEGCVPTDPDCKLGPEAREVYAGMAFSGGAFCVSACPLMLAGGVNRLASHWAYVGVHQVTTVYTQERVTYKTQYRIVNGKKKVVKKTVASRKQGAVRKTTKLSKNVRKKLLGYFAEMGIAASTLDAMLSTPPEDMRHLREDELLQFGLISRLGTADMLVAPVLCKEEASASSCSKLTAVADIPVIAAAPHP
jgi:hypothetical protein